MFKVLNQISMDEFELIPDISMEDYLAATKKISVSHDIGKPINTNKPSEESFSIPYRDEYYCYSVDLPTLQKIFYTISSGKASKEELVECSSRMMYDDSAIYILDYMIYCMYPKCAFELEYESLTYLLDYLEDRDKIVNFPTVLLNLEKYIEKDDDDDERSHSVEKIVYNLLFGGMIGISELDTIMKKTKYLAHEIRYGQFEDEITNEYDIQFHQDDKLYVDMSKTLVERKVSFEDFFEIDRLYDRLNDISFLAYFFDRMLACHDTNFEFLKLGETDIFKNLDVGIYPWIPKKIVHDTTYKWDDNLSCLHGFKKYVHNPIKYISDNAWARYYNMVVNEIKCRRVVFG